MNDLMLDIETLSTCNNAVITQIGCIYFDRYSGEKKEEILINIDIQSCLDDGLIVDKGTLLFWYEHIPTFLDNTVTLLDALKKLSEFIKKDSIVWSHATFDIPIICNSYKIKKVEVPFHYKNTRDIRTLIDISEIKLTKEDFSSNKKHDALEDCKLQIKYCVKAFNKIKND